MSDAADLLAAFESGELLRPGPDAPNLVDAARGVAAAAGARGLDLSPFARDLADSLADREHIVLILADGLGLEMLEREEMARTLRGHLHAPLRTVFPGLDRRRGDLARDGRVAGAPRGDGLVDAHPGDRRARHDPAVPPPLR